MPPKEPAFIFNDEPISADKQHENTDYFHFSEYADTIADIVAFKENKTPLTIGLYGSWGSGKTSLMRLIQKKLTDQNRYHGKQKFRITKTVWFNAWRYADQDSILAAMIEEIFRTMAGGNLADNINSHLEKLTKSFNLYKAINQIAKALSGGAVDVIDCFDQPEHKEKLPFIATFDKLFADLIYCYVLGIKECDNVQIDDSQGVLAIFIDDLDRCPHDRILDVLEAIKLFMNQKGCVFILGADKDIIRGALKDADNFMEKIVQLSFELPKMDNESGKVFLEHLNKDPILSQIAPLLIESLGHNPRRMKRLINDYNFMKSLAENRYAKVKSPIESEILLRWLIIMTIYPNFAKRIRTSWQWVATVQETIEKLKTSLSEQEQEHWRIEGKLKEIDDLGLAEYLKDKNFKDIIANFPKEKEKIELHISFTDAVGKVEEKIPTDGEKSFEFDKFSAPIKGGEFTIQATGEKVTIEKEYEMGLFPVTNSQYKHFVDSDGYTNKDYWLEGWDWREKNNILQPYYWKDEKWNQPDCPVVGVSYYEAKAYCNWLSQKDKREYRLPTEAEWEKAAGGDEKLTWPWGNSFDKDKCNTGESGIGKTTPVNKYPQGRNPYGCFDMAGNVWEWTDSWYDKDKDSKVLRGGSWFLNQDLARCAYRYFNDPNYRYYNIGFRLSRTS